MRTQHRKLSFWLLTVAIFCATVLPRLLADGMFVDGMMYATISRNLAAGLGSLWKPHFSLTLYPEFFADHPPLVFWVESVFFRLFGDHYLVEALYSLVTAAAAAGLIVWLWRRLTEHHPPLSSLTWVPVFLWLSVPQVSWAYANNMLENTLSVFMLLAVFCFVKGLTAKRGGIVYMIGGGLCICAGFLSKGPLALFPLATVGLYWLCVRTISFGRAVILTVITTVTIAIVAALVWSIDDARANLARYFEIQLLPSITGERGAHSNPLKIVTELLQELAPMVGMTLILLFVARLGRRVADGPWRLGLFMIAVGAAGSLPVALSSRQNAFYILPSFPFFALGFGILAAPVVEALVQMIGARSGRILTVATAVLLIAATAFAIVGASRNDDNPTLNDLRAIGNHVGRDAIIGICPSMSGEWGLFGFMARYYNISLDWSGAPHEYVATRGECESIDANLYERVALDLSVLKLRRLRDASP
jgi:4-amino-4-deoxy-L-arabinose transferase-like glycosyltransferase